MGATTVGKLGRVLLGSAALVVLPAGRAGASEPTISVSPDTHLDDEQLVTVTGTGLERPCVPYQGCFPVSILQCVRGAALTINNADQYCVALGNATQTADGYRAEVRVQEPFTPLRAGSSPVTCGRDGCDVVAAGIAGQFTFVTAPVSFSK